MNSSGFFGTLVRISRSIGAALNAWGPGKALPHRQGPDQDPVAITLPMQAAEPVRVEVAEVAPAPPPPASPEPISAVAQPEAPVPAAVKMRSIEEIRADLARLRQNAKERHAELRAQQQAIFPATDLMEIAPSLPLPQPAPEREARDSPETAFAATAFVDFSQVKSRHER